MDAPELMALKGLKFVSPVDGWSGRTDALLVRLAIHHRCYPAQCGLRISIAGHVFVIDEQVRETVPHLGTLKTLQVVEV